MMSEFESAEGNEAAGGDTNRFWTLPNLLCLVRLLGSPGLIILGGLEWRWSFLGLFLFLALTDWLDGKLAIALHQRTTLGARLDSWADATFYGAALAGGGWLCRAELMAEWIWIGAAVASYVLTTGYGFWKFGRWPSYHTRMAKISWGFITLGTISMILGWSMWPLRIGLASVTATNLEAMLITRTLPEWRADVLTWFRARKLAAEESSRSSNSADD